MNDARLAPLFSWRGAITDSKLSPTTKHVALSLSLYMNERGGSAFPGSERLANDTGLHQRTIERALKYLVEAGWLTIVRHGGGRGHANVYKADIPKPRQDAALSRETPAEDPVNPGTGPGQLSMNSPSAVASSEPVAWGAAPGRSNKLPSERERIVARARIAEARNRLHPPAVNEESPTTTSDNAIRSMRNSPIPGAGVDIVDPNVSGKA